MFRRYYNSLSPSEKEFFAAYIGTTSNYIGTHFMSKDPLKRKTPRIGLLNKMVEASDGKLTYKGLAEYFYIDKARALKSKAA